MILKFETKGTVDSRGGYQSIITVNDVTIWIDDRQFDDQQSAEENAEFCFMKKMQRLFR